MRVQGKLVADMHCIVLSKRVNGSENITVKQNDLSNSLVEAEGLASVI
jgi:hypothetical protein